jgi:hypothetical protein
MDNNEIVPSKIHLNNIRWEKENTFLVSEKLEKKPTYDINIAHNMMHNLEKEVVKIRLFLDVSAKNRLTRYPPQQTEPIVYI